MATTTVNLGLSLDGLSNVDTAGKNNGDILVWNSTSNKWEDAALQSGYYPTIFGFNATPVTNAVASITAQLAYEVMIPANTITENCLIEISGRVRRDSGTTILHYARINSVSGNLTGTILAGSNGQHSSMEFRQMYNADPSGTLTGIITFNNYDGYGSNVALTSLAVDWTIDQYITFSTSKVDATHIVTHIYGMITVWKQ
jgi:hypothetical protein